MRIAMTAFLFARPIAGTTIVPDADRLAAGVPLADLVDVDTLLAELRRELPERMLADIASHVRAHLSGTLSEVADGSATSRRVRLHCEDGRSLRTVEDPNARLAGLLVCLSAVASDDAHDAVLEDWMPMTIGRSTIVLGIVRDDVKGRFSDGDPMQTSVVSTPMEEMREGTVLRTRNSRYLLGRPARGDFFAAEPGD